MSTVLRAIEFLGLSIWLGSDIFLSFVVAPGAFAVLASRDQAGAIVGYSLTRMHWMGLVCGVVILLVRVLRTRNLTSLVAPAALCLVLMILLTVISPAAGSPLLAEFARLHLISVGLESGVLVAGMVAMFCMVREAAVAR